MMLLLFQNNLTVGTPIPTLVTQPLSIDQPNDVLTIAVDPLTYDSDGDKFGFWKVEIHSISWTGDGLSEDENFTLDIRVPTYNVQHDTPIADEVEIPTADESYEPARTTQYTTYMHGRVGPSAFTQGDGTVDLLRITTTVGSTGVSNFVLTVACNVTWHEITDGEIAGFDETNVVLNLNETDSYDQLTISGDSEETEGVYVLVPTSLDTQLKNRNKSKEAVPVFQVSGERLMFVNHTISKSSSHTKAYHRRQMGVYALNDGKVDANGINTRYKNDATGETHHQLATVSLEGDPADNFDVVTATLHYRHGFLAI